jgi:MoxR-like ATPase
LAHCGFGCRRNLDEVAVMSANAAAPYTPEQVRAEVAALRDAVRRWTRALLARGLHRLWPRVVAGDHLDDLVVAIEEAQGTLDDAEPPPPLSLGEPETLEAEVHAAWTDLEPLLARSRPGHLRGRLGLEDADLAWVLLAWCLERSPALLRLAGFVWSDFATKQPTVGFFCELLAADPQGLEVESARLAPHLPLYRTGCIRLAESGDWRTATPLLARPLSLADGVARWLDGGVPLDARAAPPAVSLALNPAPKRLVGVPEEVRVLVERALSGHGPALVLLGPEGVGRRALVAHTAEALGLPVRTLHWYGLTDQGDPELRFVDALRDARLAGAVPLLRLEGDGLTDDVEPRAARALGRALSRLPGPFVVCAGGTAGASLATILHARVARLAVPAGLDRARLYSQLLVQHGFLPEPGALAVLAADYAVPAGALARALAEVRDSEPASAPRPVPPQALDRALRGVIRSRLAELADRKTLGRVTRGDLVLGEEQHVALEEILSHARHKVQVLDAWGFGAYGSGVGLACLFSGPPGTGKTMAASVLASELGLDLYQVDLARMVDKYIGETEKNLSRLFDEAERAPVVLLFDEADSLFGSRAKVEKAQDRYANLEINFLLQRMERFSGISILTSNRPNDLDAAFKRRLRFRVHFPLPEAEQRAVLWQRLLPPDCLVDADFDPELLAQTFEVSGATIRSALLRGAFAAATHDRPLNQAMLEAAMRAELAELGRLASQ